MHDLIRKDSVEDLVAKRDRCVHNLTKAFALLVEARQLAGEFAASDGSYAFTDVLGYGDDSWRAIKKKIVESLDQSGWEFLAMATGLKSLMDQAAWREFRELLKKDTVALTIDTVYATFEAFGKSKHDIFERGIVNVFRGLSRDYKSNGPFAIGRRLILQRAIEGHSYARYEREKLSDIDRILHIVDGEPPPDHLGDAAAVLLAAHREGKRCLATRYMTLRWFKNGNVHVQIDDEALIARVNQIIAAHFASTLPDGRR